MLALNERYLEHNLDHYRQYYNWGWGVSCLLMLLPTDQREEMLEKFEQICQDEGFRQSTWTIDLCYLLKRIEDASSGASPEPRPAVDTFRSLADSRRAVATADPVTVLVDASMLVCDLCKHNKLKAEFRRCFGGGYTGHYIELVGRGAASCCTASPRDWHGRHTAV